MSANRRDFLRSSLAASTLVSMGAATVPTFLSRSALAAGTVKPHIHSAGLMADYFLSKRTDVYLQGAYQKIAGTSTGSVMDQAFIPGTQGLSSNSEQFVARVALRHAF